MLKKIRAIPHILLFKRSSSRSIIERDMLRWFQIYKPKLPKNSVIETLIWVLETYPEFRNLFYIRIGRYSSNLGKSLIFLAKKLYKPKETPIFAEPMEIGPGLFLRTGLATVVGGERIGENCWINPGVTIGYKTGEDGMPNIGNYVYIGAGARILGSITIGDNVVIGANAVVTKNVPSNCTIAGVPARIVKRDGVKVNEPLPSAKPLI